MDAAVLVIAATDGVMAQTKVVFFENVVNDIKLSGTSDSGSANRPEEHNCLHQ